MSKTYKLKRTKALLIVTKGLIARIEENDLDHLDKVEEAYFEALENMAEDCYREVRAIYETIHNTPAPDLTPDN